MRKTLRSNHEPVAEDIGLGSWGSNRKLKGRVEVVLLLFGPVNESSIADNQKAGVANVCSVELRLLLVQADYARCTASWSSQKRHNLRIKKKKKLPLLKKKKEL